MSVRDGRYIAGPNKDESIWDVAKVTNHRLHITSTDPNQLNRTVFHQDLSAGPLEIITSGDYPFILKLATLRATRGIIESVGVVFNSKDGSNYNTVIGSGDLNNDLDYFFPDDKFPIERWTFISGDQLKITCSNDNGLGEVFGTIITEKI